MSITYALLTLVVSVYGDPTVNFTTVPKLYSIEECQAEAPKFLKRFNNPHVGEKTTSNARVNCYPVSEEAVEQLVKSLEQDRKNSNYLYANHYQTTAVRIDGESAYMILPNLNLTSRDVCMRNGERSVNSLVGVKTERGPIAEVLFNCVRMSVSEANGIIATVRNPQGLRPHSGR
jgi:hypothetical protein